MKKVAVLTLLVMSLVAVESIQAQAAVPVGEQFQVNSYTTGWQYISAVAADAAGNFLVVWESDSIYIQAQFYDSSGIPVGSEFQVNSFTSGNVFYGPSAAADAQGNFVVVWESYGSFGSDSDYESIQARRYTANGAPLGGQFQVNSYTTDSQSYSAVAADDDGNFLVVWRSWGSNGTDNDRWSVQAQLYAATGTPVGGQFQVNTYTTDDQSRPAVAADPQGNFVVVWDSDGSNGTDTSQDSIQAQRFDASGTPVGGQFQVNSYTTSLQWRPDVAAGSTGNFVVVWRSDGSFDADSGYDSIQGQVFDTDGRPLGGQFQVNSKTPLGRYYTQVDRPSVTADAHSNFVVVWQSDGSYGTDSSQTSIQGQRYDANGTPIGGQFQVNSYTTGYQWYPAVAADAHDNFVVVWSSFGSYGTDSDAFSMQGQRYSIGLIFTDGFESGDTSAWSKTVP